MIVKGHRNKISAFTIFEVTIVLGLMSAIISIIALSINRFNEQMKTNTEIHEELNTFYAFRSNLWNELYTSDSITYKSNEIQIYKYSSITQYRIENDLLERKTEKEWIPTSFEMQELKEEMIGNEKKIVFIFNWKDQPMKLHYFCKADLNKKMDHYFENFE